LLNITVKGWEESRKKIFSKILSTVESRISGTQNSGKSRISGQFMNDQLFIRYRMNNQNSGKSRNSGTFPSDQRFH